MGVDRVEHLRRLAGRGAAELAGASAPEILAWADEELKGRLVVASSMQDAVLVHLAAQVRPGIDVLFVDTGYHFVETLAMREAVTASYPIRLVNVAAGQTVAEQDAELGPRLHERDPDRCCFLRKTRPLNTVLGLYDGWVTGVRRGETRTRDTAAPIEWDERREIVKVNPIVGWSDDQVDSYIDEHGLLVNLLRQSGYASIGCAPCTLPVQPGQDPRAGRWQGTGKEECGMHVP